MNLLQQISTPHLSISKIYYLYLQILLESDPKQRLFTYQGVSSQSYHGHNEADSFLSTISPPMLVTSFRLPRFLILQHLYIVYLLQYDDLLYFRNVKNSNWEKGGHMGTD